MNRWLIVALALCCGVAHAQGWSPQKNVEIIANSPPGGSNDKTARMLEQLFLLNKAVPTSITVVNKAGGGGSIGFAYLSQHPGDPHFLVIAGDGLLTNHVLGVSKLTYSDFSPIALLCNDFALMAVRTESPIKSGRDLAERLRKNPQGLSIGFANAFGSTRHISLALFMKAVGGNPRDLKVVVFKGSAEAITAMLGGHLDAVVIGATNATIHIGTGRMRVLGVAAPQRLGDVLASAPTWREQGVELVSGSWRGIMGAKGLTAAQVAYWEQVLQKAAATPEWKTDLDRNYWTSDFKPAAAFAKELEKDYAEMRTVLTDAGLVKQTGSKEQ
ncbi:MAG TPA: tripartite tricarboxylate transporter substrate binding protein [Burkholderiales bacterium]|nr:tripartite tricarboxylate transporter substrate binding protein [Burkholderiales bacterium]